MSSLMIVLQGSVLCVTNLMYNIMLSCKIPLVGVRKNIRQHKSSGSRKQMTNRVSYGNWHMFMLNYIIEYVIKY